MNILLRALIAIAKRTPYSHLYHADGSVYMRRLWLMPKWALEVERTTVVDGAGPHEVVNYKPKKWVPVALRLHEIVTPDYDPHCHDHPWSFVSLVLNGGYLEQRPVTMDPCFPSMDFETEEQTVGTWRGRWSLASRHCTDRHRITYVEPNTWTLIAVTRKRHWWGFYTAHGKIFYGDYPSTHSVLARTERPA